MRPHLKAVALPSGKTKEKILEIERLHKVFHMNGGFQTVLEEITFRAEGGELICILGRSGCGKSTLLKIVAGFIWPSSGKVLLKGKPVKAPGPDRCVIFQEDALFPWLTVEENIAFGLRGRGQSKKSKADEVERFLGLVGLREFRGYLPRALSGGMKQRVALARVLILKPEVLLMDEPFASLDAQSREEMQNLLLSLWKELAHTILFVTHDVNEAVILADKILFMSKNPGAIREKIRIDLPRPRSRDGSTFLGFCRKFHEALRD
ncbi:MAG: ABC transporter ATP-binding protein [Deltaproteobacteria bacterium]|nr:ABC transporter ATP-binding protein [Deltaproteobacteria bacterium]